MNKGRHLYSAGQPSRWALAHILVRHFFTVCCRKEYWFHSIWHPFPEQLFRGSRLDDTNDDDHNDDDDDDDGDDDGDDRHLLLLLFCPKADIHFTVPQRVEGSVDLGTAVMVYNP